MSVFIAPGMLLVLGFSNTQSRETSSFFFFFFERKKCGVYTDISNFILKSLLKLGTGYRHIKQDVRLPRDNKI